MKNEAWIQKSAQYYVRFTEPLDPDRGWCREDVQLAFMAGAREQPIRRLLTIDEVAELLATSVSTIRDLIRHGELVYVKVGRGTERNHVAIAPEEIESFLKRHSKRDFTSSGPSTARQSTRKTKLQLSIERATAKEGNFLTQFPARLAEAKARKRK
ncbi:excisionase family DNA binding protein [Rhizobium sp. ERR 1071]|uniref:helix-turn-helix domain-containing protein n=1 Tax=Rhizobium sp. ERR 1071 TaxID=2572677 RepID=UPI00119991DA|nr:helix-turn-helix domain-containing protein [Rhizobium sp. ERR1071]TWB19551.1 excisionase family DNA binding protein [Rhizobium sp. ERR1071]